jgi:DNA polymerase I-like protein with 3'-5' exonuclease and polymerase domains
VLQALTGSTLLKKTFDENFDLHTWTVCYMFGYDMPPDLVNPHKAASCEAWRRKYNWKGKDDPRRIFAKQGRYEMWYGGSGSNAAAAAAQFGLNATDLRVALSKLASSDPAYYTWKVRTEAEVKKTALVRTFMGRPRRFLSKGDSRRREGLDQPMQGAVSDIFNTTAVLLYNQFPQLRWGWGMHDSQKWYVRRENLTPALFESVRAIAERVHTIAGQETRFPADMSIILPPEQDDKELAPADYFALAT